MDAEFKAAWEAQADIARQREEAEDALDDISDVSPVVLVKVFRRVLAEMRKAGWLDDVGSEDWEEAIHDIAKRLNIPYIELTIAAHTYINNPEVVRDELAEWVDWCATHAPERLASRKAVA